MNCNHCIGTAESDEYEFQVRATDTPDISVLDFTPYVFCPWCGEKITDEPETYRVLLNKVRQDYQNRPPSTDPFIRLMEADAKKMDEFFKRIPPKSRFAELFKEKQPLPEGVGYNWMTKP